MLLFWTCYSVGGQNFPCDGRMFIFLHQGQPPNYTFWIDNQDIRIVNFNTFTPFPSATFGAVGFNPQDNFIYGVLSNTNQIVRLKSDGTYESIGSVPLVNNLHSFAGDCTPEGRFVCFDNTLQQLLFFDVIQDFALVKQLDLFWDPASINSGPFHTQIDDLAFDPTNPTVAYAYQGNYHRPETEPSISRGYLLKINLDFSKPNVGMVTPVGPISEEVVTHMGSLFFSKEGELFGYGSNSSWPDLQQNRFVAIDKNVGSATFLRFGPSGPASDGCSCPYNLTFQKDAEPRFIDCGNAELTFKLTVKNRYHEDFAGIILRDTLPEGIIIQSVEGNFAGQIDPATGVGTRYLTITNLQIPGKGVVSIDYKVRVSGLPLGLSSSQAFLENLPSRFGVTVGSDDPQTEGFFSDATLIYTSLRTSEDLELDIIQPTDCLTPNDGRVRFHSSVFEAGTDYNIEFIDTDNKLVSEVLTTDVDGAFSLNDLSPGNYTLIGIYPENSYCGYSLKYKDVKIQPPNESLQVSATSNSPLCTGTDLQLAAVTAPGNTVSWKGPNGFTSSELDPLILSASEEHSGSYMLTVSSGACIQTSTAEVKVHPRIQASISGNLQYCKGQSLQLTANATGELIGSNWSGPNGLTASTQTLSIPAVEARHAGDYRVSVDNGACEDTASVNIIVRSTPVIELPTVVETDLCDPVILRPEVNGGHSLTYFWEPESGLSCSDCPHPAIVPPLRTTYRLLVTNEWLCSDSAEIEIVFASEKLLYAPNAFSPNHDGINDRFQLFPGCGVSWIKKLEIYDRWGIQVYAKGPIDHHDQDVFWDGTFGGQKARSGIYTWYSEIELVNGIVRNLTGAVQLFR